MAQIKQCEYCGKHVQNSDWCKECRRIFCEYLLAQVKIFLETHISIHGSSPLPMELSNAILRESFTTKAEYEKARRTLDDLESQMKLWQSARDQAIQQFDLEWETSHPKPGSPRFKPVRVKPNPSAAELSAKMMKASRKRKNADKKPNVNSLLQKALKKRREANTMGNAAKPSRTLESVKVALTEEDKRKSNKIVKQPPKGSLAAAVNGEFEPPDDHVFVPLRQKRTNR